VEFETGLSAPFEAVMGSARTVITTSVKEGFGFSFLEPWTAGIAVTGRRIDYVCRDFEEAGLCFDGLYSGVAIPAEYAGPPELRAKTAAALSRVYAAFGTALPPAVETALDKTFGGGDHFDFGIMDEEAQERILRLAAKDRTIRDRIGAANPFLETLLSGETPAEQIEANRSAVLASYSRAKITALLRDRYRAVLAPVNQRIDRARLLDRFLDPSRLFLTGISPEENPPENPSTAPGRHA
jgi:hypothetical protein